MKRRIQEMVFSCRSFPFALLATLFALLGGIGFAVDNKGYCDVPEFGDCEICGDIDFKSNYFLGCGIFINGTEIKIDLSHHNLTELSGGFVNILYILETGYDEIEVDLSRNFLDCSDNINVSEYCDSDTQLSCGDFTKGSVCDEYPPCSYDESENKCIPRNSIWNTPNTTVHFYIKLNSDDFSGMTDTRIHEHIKQSVIEDICNNLEITEESFDVTVDIEYARTRGRDMEISITVIFMGKDKDTQADLLVQKLMEEAFSSSKPYLVDAKIVLIDHGNRTIQEKSSSGPGKVTTGAWVGFIIAIVVSVVIIIVEVVIITQETRKQRAREAERLAILQAADDLDEDENKKMEENSRKASFADNKSSSSSSETTSSFSSEDIFSDIYNVSESDSDYSSDSDESTSEDDS